MTAVSALALAAAVLLPASPRRRLDACRAPAPETRRPYLRPAVAACCAGLVVAAVAALSSALVSLAVVALGATATLRYRRRRRRRRGVEEASALQAALDVLVGELRIGAHPVRAFDVAAAECSQPSVGAGLRAVSARARLGADVAAGLRGAAASSSLPAQWQRLAVYWQLGAEHGLAMAALMHAAQRDIAERQRFSGQVEAGMAGARSSAGILSGLPALGVALGQLLGARPIGFLLSGGGLLLAGIVLVCLGLLWSDRITERLS